MAVNASVTKNENEASSNVLRRFVRKVKSAGFVNTLKDRRYFERESSKLRTKQSALLRIQKTKEYDRLRKLGKIPSRG